MSSHEYTWNLTSDKLGAASDQDTTARFKKVNANTDLVPNDFTNDRYTIETYSDLIYLDLNEILEVDTPFTLEFSMKETGPIDISLPRNYLTLGYHLRGANGVTITVGRGPGSKKVVIGTITPEGVERAISTLASNTDIVADTEYTYTLMYNIYSNSTERITLFRKVKDSIVSPVLICDSQGLSNPYISVVNRKLFFGSSMWVNEPEWSNTFDYVNMSVTGDIKLSS